MTPARKPGPQPSRRILRVGIILGGTIVEERLLRNLEPITIGQSSKATFCVPVEGLPKEWPLFAVENGRYILQFQDAMDGRISDGANVDTLDGLKNKRIQRRGDRWCLPLSQEARGKIVFGPLTVLFQFVTAPPLQPRPRLPASVRGTLLDRIEPQLSVILALSLIMHLGVAIYAHQMEIKSQNRTDVLHRAFVQEERERVIQTFDEPVPAETDAAGGQNAAKEPERKATRVTEAAPKEKSGGNEAPSEADIQEQIQASAFIKLATGAASEGGRYGEMAYTDQGADLNKSLDNVRRKGGDVAVAGRVGSGDIRGPRSGELGAEAGGGRLTGPDTGVNAGSGDRGEEDIQSLAKYEVLDVGDATLDPEDVAKRIRSKYLAGIKRCHQRALKLNPSAQGRINIAFTVGPSGRVTSSEVDGFDPTVDSCIKSLTGGWLFGIPKDDSGKPSTASFRIPLVLKPGS